MVPRMTRINGSVCVQYAEDPMHPLDPQALNALERGILPVFLRPIVDGTPGSRSVIFNVQGMITLDEHLRNGLGEAQLRLVFSAMRDMLEQGMREGMLLKNVVLDQRRVYVDQYSGNVGFVYLPFGGIAADVQAMRAFFASVAMDAKPQDPAARNMLAKYDEYFKATTDFNPFGVMDMLASLGTGQAAYAPSMASQWGEPQSQTADMHNAGMQNADAQVAGAQVTGAQNSGFQAAGMQNAGSQDAGAQGASVSGAYAQQASPVDIGTTVLSGISAGAVAEQSPSPSYQQTAASPAAASASDAGVSGASYSAAASDPSAASSMGRHARIDPQTTILGENAIGSVSAEAIGINDNMVERTVDARELNGQIGAQAAGAEAGGQPAMQTVSAQPASTQPAIHAASAQAAVQPAETQPAGQPASAQPNMQADVTQPEGAFFGAGSEADTTLLSTPLAPIYKLHRVSNNETCTIEGQRFVVGKSKYSDFQIRGTTTVSRSHAVFSVDSEGCWVEDDNSTNGTLVNGARLAPKNRKLLQNGDKLTMSDEEFIFVTSEG